MRWAEHVAHMGEMRNASEILSENVKGINVYKDLNVDERIILYCSIIRLKWILKIRWDSMD
jgi:hypothetical protein